MQSSFIYLLSLFITLPLRLILKIVETPHFKSLHSGLAGFRFRVYICPDLTVNCGKRNVMIL